MKYVLHYLGEQKNENKYIFYHLKDQEEKDNHIFEYSNNDKSFLLCTKCNIGVEKVVDLNFVCYYYMDSMGAIQIISCNQYMMKQIIE